MLFLTADPDGIDADPVVPHEGVDLVHQVLPPHHVLTKQLKIGGKKISGQPKMNTRNFLVS